MELTPEADAAQVAQYDMLFRVMRDYKHVISNVTSVMCMMAIHGWIVVGGIVSVIIRFCLMRTCYRSLHIIRCYFLNKGVDAVYYMLCLFIRE